MHLKIFINGTNARHCATEKVHNSSLISLIVSSAFNTNRPERYMKFALTFKDTKLRKLSPTGNTRNRELKDIARHPAQRVWVNC